MRAVLPRFHAYTEFSEGKTRKKAIVVLRGPWESISKTRKETPRPTLFWFDSILCTDVFLGTYQKLCLFFLAFSCVCCTSLLYSPGRSLIGFDISMGVLCL
ncbi:hypothetical protein NA56DRAFT_231682 [Hyaloscypha hepaticicola]|uniref:Uncharacterized protein n=1 Tax=Hyaloscypha hepaticicola TaxID=2082293 RepID=A0A2J6QM38_9HELO|nr:hypothetical protein NA56DRAFT_231682 [Hyaloscypha hepaticicola]